jgi:pteridine reductase
VQLNSVATLKPTGSHPWASFGANKLKLHQYRRSLNSDLSNAPAIVGGMADRVALITGGAKRVGRAIAVALAEDGFNLVIVYRRSAEYAQAMVDELSRPDRTVTAISADLFDPEAAVAKILSQFTFARLDVLVNNASLYEPADLAQTDLALIRRLNAVHFESPLLLCRAMAQKLRTARGHVINMVDVLAERPWPRYLAYCATKAALANLTVGLARELAPEVTVNGIAPGVVEWPSDYPQVARDAYLRRVPLARAGTPEDVVNLVRFLVNGGSYITGQIIRLDGGRSLT